MRLLFDAWLSREGEVPVLFLAGELDIATIPVLSAVLDSATANGLPRLVVDCARLTFVDLTGVARLLAAAEDLPGGLTLRDPPGTLQRLREVLRLEERLPLDP